jgi:hypothetical protein
LGKISWGSKSERLPVLKKLIPLEKDRRVGPENCMIKIVRN